MERRVIENKICRGMGWMHLLQPHVALSLFSLYGNAYNRIFIAQVKFKSCTHNCLLKLSLSTTNSITKLWLDFFLENAQCLKNFQTILAVIFWQKYKNFPSPKYQGCLWNASNVICPQKIEQHWSKGEKNWKACCCFF